MRTARTVALLCLLLTSSRALAQGGYNPGGAILEAALLLGVVESSLVVGSIVTAAGSTASLNKTQHGRLPWFVSSYIAGAANLAVAGYGGAVLVRESQGLGVSPAAVLATGLHGVLALWNLVVPTVGLIRGPGGGDVVAGIAPAVIGGRDRAGRRWTGVGVSIATW